MAYQRMAAASAAAASSDWDDAVVLPNVNSLVQYGEAEQQMARDLVCRAMLLGEAEILWHQALSDFKLRRQDFIDKDLWEVVSAEFRRRRDLRLGGSSEAVSHGAMSDSAKRARAASPAGPPPPTPYNQPTPKEAPRLPAQMVGTRGGNNKASGPKGPPPPTPSPLDGVVVSHAELPEGVSSLLHWSKTPLNFGKYKGKDWNYMDLAIHNGKQECSYKSWIMARVNSGGDQLRDLARFLCILDKANALPEKPSSPTSSSASMPVVRAPMDRGDPLPRADTPTSQLSSDRAFGVPTPSP